MADVTRDDRCLHCGQRVRKKLCDDLPGMHTYVWACEGCYREYGDEWAESHHGLSAPPLVVECTTAHRRGI
jgi:uncharacterized protein with PIN domain